MLAVPLALREAGPGVLVLGYRNGEREFTGPRAEFTENLAVTLTLALENAHLRRVQQSTRRPPGKAE